MEWGWGGGRRFLVCLVKWFFNILNKTFVLNFCLVKWFGSVCAGVTDKNKNEKYKMPKKKKNKRKKNSVFLGMGNSVYGFAFIRNIWWVLTPQPSRDLEGRSPGCLWYSRASTTTFLLCVRLVQPYGNIHQLKSVKRWAHVTLMSQKASGAGFSRAEVGGYLGADTVTGL